MKTLTQRIEEGQPIQRAIYNTRNAEEKRYTKLRKRVSKIIDQPYSYFMTFTLTDKHLDLTPKTHVLKIKEALARASYIDYILNNDYGDQTDRLHYHCVCAFSYQLDYNTIIEIYKYGAVNIKPVIRKSTSAISEYILKLTNHAKKKTTSRRWIPRYTYYPKNTNLKELLYET